MVEMGLGGLGTRGLGFSRSPPRMPVRLCPSAVLKCTGVTAAVAMAWKAD